MILNAASAFVPPHEAVPVCASAGEAAAGTSKVPVEPSPPTVVVGSGPPSHRHDIVCETLDPARQASKPFVVAVTRVSEVPCSGESDRLGFSVTVNVAESVRSGRYAHDAVTWY